MTFQAGGQSPLRVIRGTRAAFPNDPGVTSCELGRALGLSIILL
jgi:hypothetical protein